MPREGKNWNRQDPVTIYVEKQPNEDQMTDIAMTLEPYVYEAVESELFGDNITAKDGSIFRGIKVVKTPELNELAHLVAHAYSINSVLGNVVSKVFHIEDVNGSILYKTSPGSVKAVEKLLLFLRRK